MFKICPICRAEYRLTVSQCSDCDVSLEFPSNAPPTPALPISEMVIVYRGDPWTLQSLAEHLQEQGIASRIDTDPPADVVAGPAEFQYGGDAGEATQLAVYVAPGSYRAATDSVEVFVRSRLPSHSGDEPGTITTECPACSAPLPDPANRCNACGLEFGASEFACLDCGQPVSGTDTQCASCGQDLTAEES